MDKALQEFRKVAEEAAIAGGRVLLEHRFAPLEITHKDRQEVVTNVDTLADAAIARVLSHYYPDHCIISEESGTRTTCFALHLDCRSPGWHRVLHSRAVFLRCDGRPDQRRPHPCGCRVPSVQRRTLQRRAGTATTVNGHLVQVTDISGLKQARLILDYSPRDALRQHLHTLEWERSFNQTFRIGGSVALNMCLVAKGAADGYMYGRMRNRLKSWDTAAAALVVQSAGGRVLNRYGQPLDTQQPQGFLLCCNAVPRLAGAVA